MTLSNYTHKLKGASTKAKANAVQGLPEMIEIATGKHFEEDGVRSFCLRGDERAMLIDTGRKECMKNNTYIRVIPTFPNSKDMHKGICKLKEDSLLEIFD